MRHPDRAPEGDDGRVATGRTGMRRWLDRVVTTCTLGRPLTPYGYDYSVHDLRVDEECVCPRCLHWIEPEDIVRRTAYGPAQHEACPARFD